jgi:hypothetical protein
MADPNSYLLLELEEGFKMEKQTKETLKKHIITDLTEGKVSPPTDYTKNICEIINRRRINNDDDGNRDFKSEDSPEKLNLKFQFDDIPYIDYDTFNDVYLIYCSKEYDYRVAVTVAKYLEKLGVKVSSTKYGNVQ